MRVDFHFHASLSKKIGFRLPFLMETLQHARSLGIDAVATTDHFNGGRWEEIYPTFDREFDYVGPYYEAEGVRLYPGLEVDVAEGVHLLVIGSRDDILTYRSLFEDNLTPETFAPVETFFARQAGLELINIFAHPYRPGREIDNVPPEYYPHFDALDLNAKDLARQDVGYRRRLEAFAQQHDLPVVAGSDTHHFYQLGTVFNGFAGPFETIAELRTAITEGAYTIHVNEQLTSLVTKAKAHKDRIKQAHRTD